MTIVFTNGVFDLLHVGHVRVLQFARAQGDRLVVAINSDASAGRIKGPGRPVVPAHERAEVLRALRCVDDVQIFDEDTPELLIQQLHPDVLVKGPACRGTDIPGAAFVESHRGRVAIPDWPVSHSSTQLVSRIIRMVGAIG
jgi:rfaE bifunctional protein nucleotidyltransferase chain/domain